MTKNPNPLAETMNEASCPPVGMPPYMIVIEDDHDWVHHDKNQAVIIASIEEAADFMQLLGNTCKLTLSHEYRIAHPGQYERLVDAGTHREDNAAPFDINRAAALMKKVPLDLKNLIGSHIALKSGDRIPPRMPNKLVHKLNDANILISEPLCTGWLYHFNMFSETTELIFDHPSTHFQGMFILEALRQTGIAMGHLQGLPSDGHISLLSFNTNFYAFTERDSPVILRAFSSFTADASSEDKNIEVFVQLIQNDRICTDTQLKGYAYMSAQRAMRKEVQLGKIALRNKKYFETKVNRIIQPELSN